MLDDADGPRSMRRSSPLERAALDLLTGLKGTWSIAYRDRLSSAVWAALERLVAGGLVETRFETLATIDRPEGLEGFVFAVVASGGYGHEDVVDAIRKLLPVRRPVPSTLLRGRRPSFA